MDAILAVEQVNRSDELLRWYDENRRDLPWRRTRDPYAIWVSEVMLQQTRVETARAYYERFLTRFPDVGSLAGARLDEVLGVWSGLGYYRRARQLHRAAREVAKTGEIPRTPETLQELPGIGRYTAAAIASIAFGVVVPAVDGNVERVLSRLYRLGGPLRTAPRRRRLEELAAGLLDSRRPGDGNQALMELGATVCRPRQPRCPSCPIAAGCRALATGEVERYPEPVRRRPTRRLRRVSVVVRRDGKLLLFRRPEASELMAGLWELPTVPAAADENLSAELARRYGGVWELGPSAGVFRHAVTFRNLEVEVRRGRLRQTGRLAEGPEASWFDAEEIGSLPTSSLVGKALAREATEPGPEDPGRSVGPGRDLEIAAGE